jgi:hypothetical protein
MAQANDNPDRDFSADDSEPKPENLRDLLKRGEVAEISERARQRFGEAIVHAIRDRLRFRR